MFIDFFVELVVFVKDCIDELFVISKDAAEIFENALPVIVVDRCCCYMT